MLEHITTREGVQFVEAHPGRLGGTITPHHLSYNRNAIFKGGIRPHFYCLPIAKREEHRLALRKAATSGSPQFFLGTDTAPHTADTKECACGCAGVFNAPVAMQVYAQVFMEENALDKLEAFASLNGPRFYGLPANEARITLQAKPMEAPEQVEVPGGNKSIVVFRPDTRGGLVAVPYHLTLVEFCTESASCERRDDDGLSNTAEGCGSGTAGAGEVVAIGSGDALDHADVAAAGAVVATVGSARTWSRSGQQVGPADAGDVDPRILQGVQQGAVARVEEVDPLDGLAIDLARLGQRGRAHGPRRRSRRARRGARDSGGCSRAGSHAGRSGCRWSS